MILHHMNWGFMYFQQYFIQMFSHNMHIQMGVPPHSTLKQTIQLSPWMFFTCTSKLYIFKQATNLAYPMNVIYMFFQTASFNKQLIYFLIIHSFTSNFKSEKHIVQSHYSQNMKKTCLKIAALSFVGYCTCVT